MKHPKTLTEAIRYYADPANCVAVVKEMRWGGSEPTCPHCSEQRHYWLAKVMRWKCAACRKQFTAKTGSIFEDSPISLDKWLTALWMLVNCKNGISSYEVGRDLGITQKSAWFVLHRLRLALQTGSIGKLGGEGKHVEVDETYIGGAARFMHADRRKRLIPERGSRNNRVAVMGMLERGGEVRAMTIPNRRKHHVQAQVRTHIAAKSAIYTDALLSYQGLKYQDFQHRVIDHAEKYVDGQVHTNGLENFWSLVKRGLKGTYISVEPFHIFRYLDEQVFRYNNREMENDGERFQRALSQIAGKRLTFAEVTGKVQETTA